MGESQLGQKAVGRRGAGGRSAAVPGGHAAAVRTHTAESRSRSARRGRNQPQSRLNLVEARHLPYRPGRGTAIRPHRQNGEGARLGARQTAAVAMSDRAGPGLKPYLSGVVVVLVCRCRVVRAGCTGP